MGGALLTLDHIAVAAETLEAGVAHVEAALDVAMAPGGEHDGMGTHNRLLSLGPGLYLEVIAVNPDAPPPGQARWFDLDRFAGPPRLTNWIVRTDDLKGALAVAPSGMGTPISFVRGPFMWQMAVPPDGCLPYGGAAPALIEWETALHPADRLPASGCRLRRVEVTHPGAARLLAEFPALRSLDRVEIVTGPRHGLAATIETPGGLRRLT